MKASLLSSLACCFVLPLTSCAPQVSEADLINQTNNAKLRKITEANAPGDLVLKEIPAPPAGTISKATEPTFRSRKLLLADGRWMVNFENQEIKITTGKGKTYSLPMKWYPEEGGADGATCRAYIDGATTWIELRGSSDAKNETTRIRFVNGVMKEVTKYAVPGEMAVLSSTVVLPEDRIKSQQF